MMLKRKEQVQKVQKKNDDFFFDLVEVINENKYESDEAHLRLIEKEIYASYEDAFDMSEDEIHSLSKSWYNSVIAYLSFNYI